MENIKLIVNKQNIVSDRQSLVSDTENVYEVEFEFDEEWQGYTKFGVFKQNNVVKQVLLVDNKCLMPNEAVEDSGYMAIGVYGVSGDKRYPTIWTSPILVQLGVMEGTEPTPPTPSEWQQIITELSRLEESVETLETNVIDIQSHLEDVDDDIDTLNSNVSDLQDSVEDLDNNKVDKVEGKGLSTNDFTNADKTKLDSLENYDDTELRNAIDNLDETKQDKINQYLVNASVSNNVLDIEKNDGSHVEFQGGGASSWNDLTDKPFNTLGTTLKTTNNVLDVADTIATKSFVEGKGYQTEAQVNDIVDGKGFALDSDLQELEGRVDTTESDIDTIESKIPNQATSTNQLADKNFVNSSIATNTANFEGTYDVVEDLGLTYNATTEEVEEALESIVGTKTNNDYVFVFFTNPTTQEIEKYERYKFTSSDNTWNYEYVLNNSSFTSAQWTAINSGITSGLVALIGTALQDVQIDGTSIKSGDTANIPKASSTNLGVVKPDTSNGMGINTTTGAIFPNSASVNQVIAKTNTHTPITPSILDVAIREGLGNNGLTWTDAYKQSARDTIGIMDQQSFTCEMADGTTKTLKLYAELV